MGRSAVANTPPVRTTCGGRVPGWPSRRWPWLWRRTCCWRTGSCRGCGGKTSVGTTRPWTWFPRSRATPTASRATRSTSVWSVAKPDVVRAMLAAGWRPADAVTVRSSLEIAASVLLDRLDPDAPVSPLYVFGRKQDLAFEREVGSSADRRHHVRWWRADRLDEAGRPLWIGTPASTSAPASGRPTGQITHHIDADVDAERDRLMDDLERAGQLVRQYLSPGSAPPTRAERRGRPVLHRRHGPVRARAVEGAAVNRPARRRRTWISRACSPATATWCCSWAGFADGTPVMLFGGFAAHRGWLVLVPPVILAGACGDFLACAPGSSPRAPSASGSWTSGPAGPSR